VNDQGNNSQSHYTVVNQELHSPGTATTFFSS